MQDIFSHMKIYYSFGGNEVDVLFDKAIREVYPEVDILWHVQIIQGIIFLRKESESGVRVKVPIDGKPRKIEIGKQIVNP